MENWAHDGELLRELTLRIAALEDNVAFLELWCEEQQDSLDRFGEPYWFLEDDDPQPVRLYVVDLRDDPDADESDHQRRVRQIRTRLDNLRHGMAKGVPG